MKASIGARQMVGFVFTGVLGTLLHFLYDWTGQNPIVGAFSAVNESIWEHMKLLFFPMLLFSLWEYRLVGKDYRNFWCVKAIGTALGLGLIPALYYTYTGSLGVRADWFNIAIFFIAAAVVFWLETRLLEANVPTCRHRFLGWGYLILTGIAFIMLTYLPPMLPLFLPPQ